MRLDDGRVVPEFLAAVLASRPLPIQGDGTQTRSFMYVSDLVDGLLLVARDPDLDGLLVNIGNPDEVTVAELAQRLLTIAGSTAGTINVPGRAGRPAATLPGHRPHGRPLRLAPDGRRSTRASDAPSTGSRTMRRARRRSRQEDDDDDPRAGHGSRRLHRPPPRDAPEGARLLGPRRRPQGPRVHADRRRRVRAPRPALAATPARRRCGAASTTSTRWRPTWAAWASSPPTTRRSSTTTR